MNLFIIIVLSLLCIYLSVRLFKYKKMYNDLSSLCDDFLKECHSMDILNYKLLNQNEELTDKCEKYSNDINELIIENSQLFLNQKD